MPTRRDVPPPVSSFKTVLYQTYIWGSWAGRALTTLRLTAKPTNTHDGKMAGEWGVSGGFKPR